MMNLVLLGPPVSGKGTQAKKLVEDFGLTHLSAGELLRSEIAAQTSLGQSIKDCVESGNLLPDDIVIGLIARRIEQPDCQRGVLFDGFPRTLNQAQALDDMLNAKGQPLSLAIELQVDESLLLNRMQARIDSMIARGETPRKDDNLQTLAHRLHIYRNETLMAVPYYQQQAKHEPIDAAPAADQVYDSIKIALQAHGYAVMTTAQKNVKIPTPKPEEPQP